MKTLSPPLCVCVCVYIKLYSWSQEKEYYKMKSSLLIILRNMLLHMQVSLMTCKTALNYFVSIIAYSNK